MDGLLEKLRSTIDWSPSIGSQTGQKTQLLSQCSRHVFMALVHTTCWLAPAGTRFLTVPAGNKLPAGTVKNLVVNTGSCCPSRNRWITPDKAFWNSTSTPPLMVWSTSPKAMCRFGFAQQNNQCNSGYGRPGYLFHALNICVCHTSRMV